MIIGMAWFVITAVLYVYSVCIGQPDGIYTYENDGCVIQQKVYVADNDKNE